MVHSRWTLECSVPQSQEADHEHVRSLPRTHEAFRLMDRPVWLLDVDGVINVARPGWGDAPRSGTAYSGGGAYRMRWAPALIDRIRALHRAGGVEIRWCSSRSVKRTRGVSLRTPPADSDHVRSGRPKRR
ncbi:hypothetical protein GCM10014719_48880 [Planomonospora parontospora subsp. antibiotica]|nr:hypothetical protein GCM10014719_48880 [Planomonospora parontospora subsp. antibiotica]GII18293.1 hypothetical protein Ppa05_50190 [Planomonospora parontospora subsp. antibiotica]